MAAPRDRAVNASKPSQPGDLPTLPPLEGDTSSQVPQLPAAPLATTALEVPGYEIKGELGRGGMGVVYLANKLLMKRLVVLKVVNKALLDANPGMLDRFVREIEVAARLDHENVVKAYHAFWAGERLVFEMEYVEGEDLAKVVKRQGPLPIAHACHYVSQAAMGLQAAHLLHMVHRDIKPHNLILTRKGKRPIVKILDFGLAKAVRSEETATDLTGLGMLGTPAFMAPEQAVDAARADIRADIYGLGCTLYFLLTGHPLFAGNSHFAVLKAHESAEAPSLTKLRPGTPVELDAIAAKMLAKKPANRYQQPIEVAKALAPIIKTALQPPKKNAAIIAAKVESAPVKAPRRRLSAGVWLMGIGGILGVVLLAVAIGAGLLFSGAAPTTSPGAGRYPPNHSDVDGLHPVSEPARAVAPFDAVEAKQFQQAWADYLHVPVVREVNLGGGTTMKLTLIPPGTFLMGRNGQKDNPHHRVEITQPYYVGTFQVTKGQFAAFVREAKYRTEAERAEHVHPTWQKPSGVGWPVAYVQTNDDPVVYISWNDATKFCEWLSQKESRSCQLLTEAQWEYACRAGTQTAYSFGDDPKDLSAYAWYSDNSESHTHPVGGKTPNPWGLYDMHGNVSEWCQDVYGPLDSKGISDPINLNSGDARVLRGGSWNYNAVICRAAFRSGNAPDSRSYHNGLRVCFRLD